MRPMKDTGLKYRFTSRIPLITMTGLRRCKEKSLPVRGQILSIMVLIMRQAIAWLLHRKSAGKDADKIIVMDDGEAVGMGTHDELLKNCEIYSEIYKSQMNEKEGV